MDSRLKKALVCLLLILTAPAVTAQSAKVVSLYVNGGGAFTYGTLGHRSELGYFGRVGISFRPLPASSPEAELIITGQYAGFPSNSDTYGDITMLIGGLEAKLNRVLSHTPNVYIIGGAGLARTEIDDSASLRGFTEDNPWASVGIGLESGKLFIEMRATNVFGSRIKNYTFFPLTIGIGI